MTRAGLSGFGIDGLDKLEKMKKSGDKGNRKKSRKDPDVKVTAAELPIGQSSCVFNAGSDRPGIEIIALPIA